MRVLGVLCLLALGMRADHAEARRVRRGPVPLITTVHWTDTEGRSGSTQFEGVADRRELRGIMRAGREEVVVTGTIGTDGAVHGRLESRDGAPVGTFSGRVDASGALTGAYAIDGGGGGTLGAAADVLPGRR